MKNPKAAGRAGLAERIGDDRLDHAVLIISTAIFKLAGLNERRRRRVPQCAFGAMRDREGAALQPRNEICDPGHHSGSYGKADDDDHREFGRGWRDVRHRRALRDTTIIGMPMTCRAVVPTARCGSIMRCGHSSEYGYQTNREVLEVRKAGSNQ
jgi:hypothetical protein